MRRLWRRLPIRKRRSISAGLWSCQLKILQQAVILAGLGEALRRQAKHEEGEAIYRRAIELYHQLG